MAFREEYKIGVKREIVHALSLVFKDQYPDEQLRNRVRVSSTFPFAEIRYPFILITFSEGPIRNVGLGHYALEQDPNKWNPDPTTLDDQPSGRIYKHFRFQGNINFNILALSPQDRDMLSEGLVNILAFSDLMPEFAPFWNEIRDSDYISIALLTDEITPGGDTDFIAPWDPEGDERVFSATYSVPIFGEFFTDPISGGMIRISQVDTYAFSGNFPDDPPYADDPEKWYPEESEA